MRRANCRANSVSWFPRRRGGKRAGSARGSVSVANFQRTAARRLADCEQHGQSLRAGTAGAPASATPPVRRRTRDADAPRTVKPRPLSGRSWPCRRPGSPPNRLQVYQRSGRPPSLIPRLREPAIGSLHGQNRATSAKNGISSAERFDYLYSDEELRVLPYHCDRRNAQRNADIDDPRDQDMSRLRTSG